MKILLILILCLSSNALQAQIYSSAESAEYDSLNSRWLVSNGEVVIDDGQGNLSTFGDGTSSANYGMEVLNGHLFTVGEGGTIFAYDLTTDSEVGTLPMPNAGFLNGMTNDGDSTLYVTDFSGKKIYKINAADPTIMTAEVVVNNTQVTPNGVVFDGPNNRLIYTDFGQNAKLTAVNLDNYSLSTLVTTNVSSVDGIDEDNEGRFYISSWGPNQISRFNNDFSAPLEIITTPFINRPADIGYARATDTLAIPIGSDVVFVGFEPTNPSSTTNLSAASFNYSIYPNPISDASYIAFELPRRQQVRLKIVDANGRIIRQLIDYVLPAGEHKVLLAGHNLSLGVYYCHLQLEQGQLIQRILSVQ